MSSYLKSTLVVSLSTLLSRILGLVRDISLAAMFGAGMVLDAFVLAFTLPNLFRRFFGEGALASAFIPVFTDELEKQGKARAYKLANKVLTLLVVLLGCIVLAGIPICLLLAHLPGISEKNALALDLTAIMLPYLLLICLTATLGAILNALRHFLAPSLAPAVLNIAWLIGIFLVAPFLGNDPRKWAYGMALAILAGGVLQVVMQLPPLRSRQLELHPMWDIGDPGMRKVLANIGPVMWGTAALQINVLVDRLIAWLMIPHDGALTVLYMGNRLVQFPLAMIGISLATVVFPLFTRHAALGEYGKLARRIPQALRITLFLSLPASIGLMILATPIISLIYRHNQFSAHAASTTAMVLIAYSAGLWVYSLLQITAKTFYSMGDMKTPMRVATWCVLSNLIMNLSLVPFLQETGLAISTSLNALLNWIMLFYFLHKKISLHWEGFLSFLIKTSVSVAAMGFCVVWLAGCFKDTTLLQRLGKVTGSISGGIVVYLVCTALLRVPELKKILSLNG